MKFPIPLKCSCGHEFSVIVRAEERSPVATCPKCYASGYSWDPLTISLGGSRLLHRSEAEMRADDYSMSIICSAIAVECFLTRAFLKWKGVANIGVSGHLPTEAEESVWEKEFPRSGGFPGPADFVSNALTGMNFDDFATNDPAVIAAMAGFPDAIGKPAKDYFQKELFQRHNRIMHWGKLNYSRTDALLCLDAAKGIIAILKVMDKQKYEKMERDWRHANP